jgi:putative transcriptional regulator
MTASNKHSTYLDGKMLIAMPNIGDPRFERTVIYLWHHSEEGAMGIVVNKAADDLSFAEILERLEVIEPDQGIALPPQAQSMPVQAGRSRSVAASCSIRPTIIPPTPPCRSTRASA